MLTGMMGLPPIGARVVVIRAREDDSAPETTGTVSRTEETPTGPVVAVKIDGAGPEVRVRPHDLRVFG